MQTPSTLCQEGQLCGRVTNFVQPLVQFFDQLALLLKLLLPVPRSAEGHSETHVVLVIRTHHCRNLGQFGHPPLLLVVLNELIRGVDDDLRLVIVPFPPSLLEEIIVRT